jgi:hypothetical protein
VVAIEKPSDFSSLKSEDLQGSFEAHESRLVDKKLSSRLKVVQIIDSKARKATGPSFRNSK